MEPWSSPEILRAAAARLSAAGIDDALREARLLSREANGPDQFEEFVRRREAREPFCYIIGRREFWSLDFEVTPAVLIPRPDSETLVEAALKEFGAKPPARIIDLGTGSGCLIISLLTEWREATGVAVDISPAALDVARRNAGRLGTAARMTFDCRDFATGYGERFDLVVSNPPYIADGVIETLEPDVRAFEPVLALSGGADGLEAYRQIASVLPGLLLPQGRAILEIGYDQGESVTRILENQGLRVIRIVKDLGGHDRVVVASLPH
jgi:release factor glutamine methyltransferase